MSDLSDYFSDKDRIKQLEDKIISLQKNSVTNRNDKYKYRLRVDKFLSSGGISKRALQIEKAKLLVSLIKSDVISLTAKQVSDICFIGTSSIYKLMRST